MRILAVTLQISTTKRTCWKISTMSTLMHSGSEVQYLGSGCDHHSLQYNTFNYMRPTIWSVRHAHCKIKVVSHPSFKNYTVLAYLSSLQRMRWSLVWTIADRRDKMVDLAAARKFQESVPLSTICGPNTAALCQRIAHATKTSPRAALGMLRAAVCASLGPFAKFQSHEGVNLVKNCLAAQITASPDRSLTPKFKSAYSSARLLGGGSWFRRKLGFWHASGAVVHHCGLEVGAKWQWQCRWDRS